MNMKLYDASGNKNDGNILDDLMSIKIKIHGVDSRCTHIP